MLLSSGLYIIAHASAADRPNTRTHFGCTLTCVCPFLSLSCGIGFVGNDAYSHTSLNCGRCFNLPLLTS